MNQMYELKSTIKELIKNILVRNRQLIEEIRNNSIMNINNRLVFFIDDLSVLVNGITVLNKENITSLDIEELNEKLVGILGAMENNDYIYIVDLFEYELLPLFEYWDECITND